MQWGKGRDLLYLALHVMIVWKCEKVVIRYTSSPKSGVWIMILSPAARPHADSCSILALPKSLIYCFVGGATAGARRFSVRRAGCAQRVLLVGGGGERPRTVVEEGHLQGDRSSRRGRARVLQVIQLAGAAC